MDIYSSIAISDNGEVGDSDPIDFILVSGVTKTVPCLRSKNIKRDDNNGKYCDSDSESGAFRFISYQLRFQKLII